MRGAKSLRQSMTHEIALDLLRSDPSLLESTLVRKRLEQKRAHAGGDLYEQCLDIWETLVSSSDVAGIEHYATGSDGLAEMMRAVSPLGCLLSEVQRLHVIERAHQIAA